MATMDAGGDGGASSSVGRVSSAPRLSSPPLNSRRSVPPPPGPAPLNKDTVATVETLRWLTDGKHTESDRATPRQAMVAPHVSQPSAASATGAACSSASSARAPSAAHLLSYNSPSASLPQRSPQRLPLSLLVDQSKASSVECECCTADEAHAQVDPVRLGCDHCASHGCLVGRSHCPACAKDGEDEPIALPVDQLPTHKVQLKKSAELVARCEHAAQGCTFLYAIRPKGEAIFAHFTECEFVPVTCAHCRDVVQRNQLAEHLATQCAVREIPCRLGCIKADYDISFVLTSAELKTRLFRACDLINHVRSTCPRREVKCGCGGEYVARDKAKHNLDNAHLRWALAEMSAELKRTKMISDAKIQAERAEKEVLRNAKDMAAGEVQRLASVIQKLKASEAADAAIHPHVEMKPTSGPFSDDAISPLSTTIISEARVTSSQKKKKKKEPSIQEEVMDVSSSHHQPNDAVEQKHSLEHNQVNPAVVAAVGLMHEVDTAALVGTPTTGIRKKCRDPLDSSPGWLVEKPILEKRVRAKVNTADADTAVSSSTASSSGQRTKAAPRRNLRSSVKPSFEVIGRRKILPVWTKSEMRTVLSEFEEEAASLSVEASSSATPGRRRPNWNDAASDLVKPRLGRRCLQLIEGLEYCEPADMSKGITQPLPWFEIKVVPLALFKRLRVERAIEVEGGPARWQPLKCHDTELEVFSARGHCWFNLHQLFAPFRTLGLLQGCDKSTPKSLMQWYWNAPLPPASAGGVFFLNMENHVLSVASVQSAAKTKQAVFITARMLVELLVELRHVPWREGATALEQRIKKLAKSAQLVTDIEFLLDAAFDGVMPDNYVASSECARFSLA